MTNQPNPAPTVEELYILHETEKGFGTPAYSEMYIRAQELEIERDELAAALRGAHDAPTYDTAIRDLAKYLPDGWVAQDECEDPYLWVSESPIEISEGYRGWDSVKVSEEKRMLEKCPD